MTASRKKIAQFKASEHYKFTTDIHILDPKYDQLVQPSLAGGTLVAQYYAHKYKTNITLKTDADAPVTLLQFESLLEQCRANKEDNYRHAFILQFGTVHSTLVIYLKEEKEEGLLFTDVQGKLASTSIPPQTPPLPIFDTPMARQSDLYSCHTDSLVMARDATGIDPVTKSYRIPKLLSALKSRATLHSDNNESKTYHETKLPDALLRTAQLSDFVKQNKEKNDEVIHKTKTLKELREKTTDKNVLILSKSKKEHYSDINNYVKNKGIKLIDSMEVQFYVNELERLAKVAFTDSLRKNFSISAKELCKEKTITKDNQAPRVHALAEKFLASMQSTEKLSAAPSLLAKKTNVDEFKVENQPLPSEAPNP